jgi:hypothetical protein
MYRLIYDTYRIQFVLFEKMKISDRHMQVAVSCSNQLNSTEKRGGATTILNGKREGQKEKIGIDDKGRWSTMMLKGEKDKRSQ